MSEQDETYSDEETEKEIAGLDAHGLLEMIGDTHAAARNVKATLDRIEFRKKRAKEQFLALERQSNNVKHDAELPGKNYFKRFGDGTVFVKLEGRDSDASELMLSPGDQIKLDEIGRAHV